MLKEITLYGETDKVKYAIARLRLHEPSEGYYIAFSGGKDSCIILDLCKRAGVRYDVHYNITTVDPPELVQFIQSAYPEAWQGRNHPAKTMWQLIPEKRMPPTRTVRYCCQILKEYSGRGRVVVTGIRHAESSKRANRKLVETCVRHRDKSYLHPIIDWSDAEVWEYIHAYHVPYCSLYDEGFRRLGCVMCPYQGAHGMMRDAKRWPIIAHDYELAFQRMIDKRLQDGYKTDWRTGEEVMNWWTSNDHRVKENDAQITLFGLRLDEAAV